MTELTVAIRGNLEKMLKQELKDGEVAVTRAMREGGTGLKKDLRRDVTRARLGPRLGKTWRALTFPKTGTSLGAAALVFTKAPRIIDAFERGAVIRGSRGNLLAIPSEAVPKRLARTKGGVTPAAVEKAMGIELRPVKRPGKPTILVADGLVARGGKRGGFRKATVRKATKTQGARVALKGLTTVVMFTLLPQVRLKKRLNVARAAGKAQRRLPRLILRNYPKTAGT